MFYYISHRNVCGEVEVLDVYSTLVEAEQAFDEYVATDYSEDELIIDEQY